jgi:hypothetical protein
VTPEERAAELMRGKDDEQRWQVAFDELLMGVTAFLNGVDDRDALHWRAKVAEAIANLPESELERQVRFVVEWYGQANAVQDLPQVGEILEALDRAMAGEDVQQSTLEAMRRMRGEQP